MFFDDALSRLFGEEADQLIQKSSLLQYLQKKTKSVSESPKSRANYANLYAIYVVTEDYLKGKFDEGGKYGSYEGARFSDLFERQRQLPFGEKLQNHALNNRCNDEFRKFFGAKSRVPIIRNLETQRYWINERLLRVKVNSKTHNIARAVVNIIDAYSKERLRQSSAFLQKCLEFKANFEQKKFEGFVRQQISPTADARIFEIVSYVVLKAYYATKGRRLYKTGRTNANDGGIDFVMRPPGRFFQVTEVMDFNKYFLDIDKIERFPITFVVKTMQSPKEVRSIVLGNARQKYSKSTIGSYSQAIEKIITIPLLLKRLETAIAAGLAQQILQDLILYYKVEFNVGEEALR